MKKLCRILIPGAFDGAICFLLFTYQVQAVESPSAQSPLFWANQDADVFIDIPNLRQYGGYTCGTTCVQMVMILLSG